MSATANAKAIIMVIGRPMSTKMPVTPSECRKRLSPNRAMYWSSPTKFTLNGVRRSREVMSVNDIAMEEMRGISMNTQKMTANGSANPHASSVWRRRRELPAPFACALVRLAIAVCPTGLTRRCRWSQLRTAGSSGRRPRRPVPWRSVRRCDPPRRKPGPKW